VIKTADYIVDLGPEGGDAGGQVVATGTPEEVAQVPESYTGQYLKQLLDKRGGAGSRGKRPAQTEAAE
jgi:excinuclease ABC subunit A